MPVPPRAGKSYVVTRPVTLGVVLLIGIAMLTVSAGAAPPPTRADVERLGEEVSRLDEELNQGRLRLAELRQAAAAAQATVRRQQAAVAALRREIAARAAAQYMGGSLATLEALLSDRDSKAVVEKAETLAVLAQREGDLLATAGAHAHALQLAMADADRAEQAQVTEVAALQQRKTVLVAKLGQLRALLARVPEPPAAPAPSDLPPASGRAAIAVRTALAQVGDAYQWGGGGPDTFDCSGLTMYSWGRAGVSLPHSSRAQYAALPKVPRSALRPGDLVFFGSPIHHVGIYIGDGQMVDAPSSGRRVQVRGILRDDYVGAARPT